MNVFLHDYNNVLEFLRHVDEFNIVDCVDKSDIVVVTDEQHPVMHEQVMMAKGLGIPTVNVQHGALWTRFYLPPFNKLLYVDKHLVWGKTDYDNMVKAGCDKNRVVVTGTSVFERIKQVDKNGHSGINISYFPLRSFDDNESNYAVLESLVSTGYNITVKLISSGMYNIDRWLSYLDDNFRCSVVCSSANNIWKAVDVINNSDVIVDTCDGTPGLIACIKDVPILHCDTNCGQFFSDIGDLIHGTELLGSTIESNIVDPDKNFEKRRLVREEIIDLTCNSEDIIINEIKNMVLNKIIQKQIGGTNVVDEKHIYENNMVLNTKELIEGEIVLKSLPVDFTIGTTLKCNINCVMCYRNATNKNVSRDIDTNILFKLTPYLKYLNICRWHCDGEIFASKNIDAVLDMMGGVPNESWNGFSTNGLMLWDYADKIVRSNVTAIDVSIDAVDTDLYKNIRRGSNLVKVVCGIKKVMELAEFKNRYIEFKIVFVAMKMNIRELPKIVDLAGLLNVKTVHVMPFNPHVVSLGMKGQGLTDSFELEKEYFLKAYRAAGVYGVNLIHPYDFKFLGELQ